MGNAQISVFSYFDFPAGKTSADLLKNEREVWKPAHDARVKDGTMKGELRHYRRTRSPASSFTVFY